MDQHGTDDAAADLNRAAKAIAGNLRRGALAPIWILMVAAMIDLPLMTLALWFAQYATIPGQDFWPPLAALHAFFGALLMVAILGALGFYTARAMASSWRFAKGTIAAALVAVLAIPITSEPVALLDWLSASATALAIAIIPSRLGAAALSRWVIDAGLLHRRAIIAGGGEPAEDLISGMMQREDTDVSVHGIFDDRDDIRSPPMVLGVPKLGGYEDMVLFAQRAEVDLVIITLPIEATERISWIMKKLQVLPIEIRLSMYSKDFSFECSSEYTTLLAAKGEKDSN